MNIGRTQLLIICVPCKCDRGRPFAFRAKNSHRAKNRLQASFDRLVRAPCFCCTTTETHSRNAKSTNDKSCNMHCCCYYMLQRKYHAHRSVYHSVVAKLVPPFSSNSTFLTRSSTGLPFSLAIVRLHNTNPDLLNTDTWSSMTAKQGHYDYPLCLRIQHQV